jgi:hypothetical protein
MRARLAQRQAPDERARLAYIDMIPKAERPPTDLEVPQILFLAAVAAVVLYQLYATLGRRVGVSPRTRP